MRHGPNSLEYQLLFKNLPKTYLSSVVSGELYAGCVDDIGLELVRQFTRHVEKTGRIVTPTHPSWNRAGGLLAKIRRSGPQYASKAAGFFHDILIVLSAVQIGATVYTADEGDFRLLRRYQSFSLEVVSSARGH
jgi:predicted nucleic acid-binding protein